MKKESNSPNNDVATIEAPVVDSLAEQKLNNINPQIADAIRAIQAERSGQNELEWTEFSSHTQG